MIIAGEARPLTDSEASAASAMFKEQLGLDWAAVLEARAVKALDPVEEDPPPEDPAPEDE